MSNLLFPKDSGKMRKLAFPLLTLTTLTACSQSDGLGSHWSFESPNGPNADGDQLARVNERLGVQPNDTIASAQPLVNETLPRFSADTTAEAGSPQQLAQAPNSEIIGYIEGDYTTVPASEVGPNDDPLSQSQANLEELLAAADVRQRGVRPHPTETTRYVDPLTTRANAASWTYDGADYWVNDTYEQRQALQQTGTTYLPAPAAFEVSPLPELPSAASDSPTNSTDIGIVPDSNVGGPDPLTGDLRSLEPTADSAVLPPVPSPSPMGAHEPQFSPATAPEANAAPSIAESIPEAPASLVLDRIPENKATSVHQIRMYQTKGLTSANKAKTLFNRVTQ
jgi:hypothetical protein